MVEKYKERVKSFFSGKPNYKELYDKQLLDTEYWEFKYNKLSNQLKAIIKESDL